LYKLDPLIVLVETVYVPDLIYRIEVSSSFSSTIVYIAQVYCLVVGRDLKKSIIRGVLDKRIFRRPSELKARGEYGKEGRKS
jgi:hypothetical protein